MKVDHTFLEKDEYNCFPLIAAEHENGGLGSRDGKLPGPKGNASIEWALWKVLSIRAHLSVLVAYPGRDSQDKALHAVGQMLRAWQAEYQAATEVLVLFGPGSVAQEKKQPGFKTYRWSRSSSGLELIEMKTGKN
jgi:hypothetical protein